MKNYLFAHTKESVIKVLKFRILKKSKKEWEFKHNDWQGYHQSPTVDIWKASDEVDFLFLYELEITGVVACSFTTSSLASIYINMRGSTYVVW